jgi:GTP cyclohydrolase II
MNARRTKPSAQIVAEAMLPSEFGSFRLIGFTFDEDDSEHIAIVHGRVENKADVLLRVHSECLTGDVLGSLRCDCRQQLHASLERIAQEPCGVVLYLRQEGRGIGLLNKIRAYQLQDHGLDTVDANLALGFSDDQRDYSVGAQMIEALGIRSIRLMTNNPNKVEALSRHGVSIASREPHVMPRNEFNSFYLDTKARRSGHMLPVGDELAAK